MELDLNDYNWGATRHIMTEYEILSNIIERDQLEQVGKERHLISLFERGKRHGLSQIELFELAKYL